MLIFDLWRQSQKHPIKNYRKSILNMFTPLNFPKILQQSRFNNYNSKTIKKFGGNMRKFGILCAEWNPLKKMIQKSQESRFWTCWKVQSKMSKTWGPKILYVIWFSRYSSRKMDHKASKKDLFGRFLKGTTIDVSCNKKNWRKNFLKNFTIAEKQYLHKC